MQNLFEDVRFAKQLALYVGHPEPRGTSIQDRLQNMSEGETGVDIN